MSIKMKPVAAFVVDVSGVQDIERERLKVTFENGRTLFFAVAVSSPKYPQLVLDRISSLGDENELVDYFAEKFYRDYSWWDRLSNKVRHFFDLRGYASSKDLTYRQVHDQLRIELFMGNDLRASPLCVGHLLKVIYMTGSSNPRHQSVSWGLVQSIDEYTIQPTSPAAFNKV